MSAVIMTDDVQPAPRRGGTWKQIVRVLTALCLIVGLVGATREEVGAWFARAGTPEGLRKAESWDPANPNYPAAIARLEGAHLETADARSMARDLEAATRLGPHRAFDWANLAEAYERDGRTADAEGAFGRALKIFPKSPEINWQYANYLVQTEHLTVAYRPLEEAILGDPQLRTGAFDLAWRAGGTSEQVLEIIPARQDILLAYLDYLARTERLDAAGDVWRRLIASPEPFDTDAAFRYFDALFSAHRVDGLMTVWTDLAQHDPAKFHWLPGNANRMTNGSFEAPLLNGGFGWRVPPIDGVKIRVDSTTAREGMRSLEIEFQGKENVEFSNLVQYVAVEPNSTYQFRAFARREGITTDSGPRIAIYDAYDREALSIETGNLTGTADWEEQALAFRTGARTRLVVVQIVRPRSNKLDNRIAGTVWLDDFSLTEAP